MKTRVRGKALLLLLCLLIVAAGTDGVHAAQGRIPNPNIIFMGSEYFEANGKQWIRYKYDVVNSTSFPDTLFEASPALPPCGSNTKAARTWVTVYNSSGKELKAFCAFKTNGDLSKIWFALELDSIPPSWVYIELNDRKTETKYKSNLAETTM